MCNKKVIQLVKLAHLSLYKKKKEKQNFKVLINIYNSTTKENAFRISLSPFIIIAFCFSKI